MFFADTADSQTAGDLSVAALEQFPLEFYTTHATPSSTATITISSADMSLEQFPLNTLIDNVSAQLNANVR